MSARMDGLIEIRDLEWLGISVINSNFPASPLSANPIFEGRASLVVLLICGARPELDEFFWGVYGVHDHQEGGWSVFAVRSFISSRSSVTILRIKSSLTLSHWLKDAEHASY